MLADSEGLLCYPGQHPSGSCPQPWLSEQGEASAKNVCCELIACVQQPLSAHPALPIVRDSEYTASQVEPDFTGQNGGMSERGVG